MAESAVVKWMVAVVTTNCDQESMLISLALPVAFDTVHDGHDQDVGSLT